ncbi:28 kDa ribonucleoprotein, chloroplastic [Amaranthus tricolor]|uniref:28 kDa ribonucleoprotein, chloroplastic n=1 Tax=Amaranthus tricolor TaxID=29722 RepID=UPI002582FC39|nr:28 kDa ribonucleoprotein, chloroplastic [Amaranthus tricolor]
MATTSTTTFQSSLCSPQSSIKCLATKHIISEPFLLKFGCTRKSYSPLNLQHFNFTNESISSILYISHKWRAPKVTATVAEEEALETAEAAEEMEVSGESQDNGGDQSEASTKLYFGNLPYLCDSAQLAGIVQQYGTPELVEVLYNRVTGKSRGFAFVTMSSVEDCDAVIENLDGSEYGGRFLRVNYADKPKKREPLYPETEHKLFVGNLSWSVTSDSLYKAFQEYGNVVGARVLYDGETGNSRGYGFVSYATRSEMENALTSLNGMELEGRALRISLAEGKKS